MSFTMDDYKKIFSDLKDNGYFGRLGKTFKTKNKNYFYDTGTGKIAEVNNDEYLVLQCMLENDGFEALQGLDLPEDNIMSALKEITDSVYKEHTLSAPKLTTMTGEPTVNLEKTLSSYISNLTLEVTDICNLRCKYCIYNEDNPSFRGFGNKLMTFEIAKKAIDFFNLHSYDRDIVYFGFYGGEPLINYDVIKQSVEYIDKTISGKKVVYAATTNATLITNDIANFLAEHNFEVLISLDGPEEIHNSNRIFVDGRGSFNETIRGIKILIEAFKRQKKLPTIGFSIVTSGPNYNEKYTKIQNFFNETDWLPENYQVLTSTAGIAPEEIPYVLPQSQEERDFFLSLPLLDWNNQQNENDDIFSSAYINKYLTVLHKRLLADKPVKDYGMNGCCVPGGRKIYISVDGEMYPCEKMGDVPSLGNVRNGLDIDKIKKHYVDDFINEAKKYCKNCWAVNLCSLCYVDCYDKNGVHFKYRNKHCIGERKFLELILSTYHEILDQNPQRIESLNQIEFS